MGQVGQLGLREAECGLRNSGLAGAYSFVQLVR
jgi:hypothetical protein